MRSPKPDVLAISLPAQMWLATSIVLLLGCPVHAQSEDLGIGYQTAIEQVKSISPEQCVQLFPMNPAAPEIADEDNSEISGLVIEALRRYCAASSGTPLSEPEAPRSTGDQAVADGQAQANLQAPVSMRLIGEAEYFIEIATQVDAEAANALLRRLLGTGGKVAN